MDYLDMIEETQIIMKNDYIKKLRIRNTGVPINL